MGTAQWEASSSSLKDRAETESEQTETCLHGARFLMMLETYYDLDD